MRYCAFLIFGSIALGGCAAAERGAVIGRPASPAYRANLALGPTADHAWVATQIAPRSDWPAVATGYRVDELTFYTTAIYDAQSYYDRFSSLYYEAEAVETGVRVR